MESGHTVDMALRKRQDPFASLNSDDVSSATILGTMDLLDECSNSGKFLTEILGALASDVEYSPSPMATARILEYLTGNKGYRGLEPGFHSVLRNKSKATLKIFTGHTFRRKLHKGKPMPFQEASKVFKDLESGKTIELECGPAVHAMIEHRGDIEEIGYSYRNSNGDTIYAGKAKAK